MNSAHPDRKQKIKHELREMLELFLYLAFFFCALAIYDMLLLRQYNVEYLTISFAIINALVITKVIMIGEYAKLGKRHEDKASRDIRFEQFAGRAIVVFCVFIPLFAWREFRRAMGEEEFRTLVYGSKHSTN